jgi:hypothetical protein
MSERLFELLGAALPAVSPTSAVVLKTIAERNGRVGELEFLVRRAGLRSRHQLARKLRHDGLPGVEELCGWVSVLGWLLDSELTGMSLFKLSHRIHIDPATCYRVVRRVTGRSWSELKVLGPEWLILKFRDRCATIRSERGGREQYDTRPAAAQ